MPKYRPLIIVLLFVVGLDFATQYLVTQSFTVMDSMRYFMAYFFLLFGAFKVVDLKGFVNMFAEYDIVTKRIRAYGYLYPFLELALGFLYLFNLYPVETNIATISIMSISTIGVLQAVTGKRKIRCACLGAVIKLPMSTVTIIENVSMEVMAMVMLILLLQ